MLLQLSKSRSHGKEPLVDYSSSHVVTSNQCLAILTRKAMDKEILDKFKKFKAKEKEEKIWKQVQDTFTQVKQIVQRNIEKEDRTKFNQPWSITIIKVVGEWLHNYFKASSQMHPLGFRRSNLVFTFEQQKIDR